MAEKQGQSFPTSKKLSLDSRINGYLTYPRKYISNYQ